MTKFVVTGGAGFIGSALVRALLAEGGAEIDVIDNLMTGYETNLAEVRSSIKLHRVDIRDYDVIRKEKVTLLRIAPLLDVHALHFDADAAGGCGHRFLVAERQ